MKSLRAKFRGSINVYTELKCTLIHLRIYENVRVSLLLILFLPSGFVFFHLTHLPLSEFGPVYLLFIISLF